MIYSLGDFSISSAGTSTGTPITDLNSMREVTLSARLAYGSGGTTAIAYVQTSFNQGATWVDIARMDFATSGIEKIANLSGSTPRTSPLTVTSLIAEGGNDGVLGDRLRAVVTSTGTYAGSTVLSVRASVR